MQLHRNHMELHGYAQHCMDYMGLQGLHVTVWDCTVPHGIALLCSVQSVLFYQNCQGRTLCVYFNYSNGNRYINYIG